MAACPPRRRRALPWLWLLLALPAGAAHAEDLLEIYALARASDPVLATAEAATGIAREGVSQARAPLLPQWSLSWDYSQQRQGSETRSRELASRISQVLVDYAKLAQLRSAQARADVQLALLESTRQALAVRVATTYFRVLSARESLNTVQANEQAFAQQVQQAEARYAAGLGAQLDIEQVRTYHALARANTITAAKTLHDARQALAEITGQPAGELKPLGQELPTQAPMPADASVWVEQALRDNPALRAEALSLAASEESLTAARSAHLPTLSLGLDSSRQQQWLPQTLSNGVSSRETTVGLSLQLPLFSGGATESQRRQAAYQRDSARESLEQRRRQLVRETREQFEAVQSSLAQLAATRAAVDAAGRALAATQAGQQLGTRSMTDLLLAIQNQGAALNAHAQARHQLVLARLLLQQAAGTVDEAQLAAINALLQ